MSVWCLSDADQLGHFCPTIFFSFCFCLCFCPFCLFVLLSFCLFVFLSFCLFVFSSVLCSSDADQLGHFGLIFPFSFCLIVFLPFCLFVFLSVWGSSDADQLGHFGRERWVRIQSMQSRSCLNNLQTSIQHSKFDSDKNKEKTIKHIWRKRKEDKDNDKHKYKSSPQQQMGKQELMRGTQATQIHPTNVKMGLV